MLAWPQVSHTTRSNPALTLEMVAIRMATDLKCGQLLFFCLIVCVSVISLTVIAGGRFDDFSIGCYQLRLGCYSQPVPTD